MLDKEQPSHSNANGHHIGLHFGKMVEVYTTPAEHWCVVYHSEDTALTARWSMPKELTVAQAAALAAFKTEDADYDTGWPTWPHGWSSPKAS